MKYLLIVLISLNAFCNEGKVKCKTVREEAGDGCNTCTREVCTDGIKQWYTESITCTVAYCVRHIDEKAFNSKDWQ